MNPSSLSRLVLHFVFVTKYREPKFFLQVEQGLHAYLIGVFNNKGSEVYAIGGYYDHVHILCELPRTLTTAKLAEAAKSNSSRWMKSQLESLADFTWQPGYAVFSVYYKDRKRVIQYIKNQKNHHTYYSYLEEENKLLNDHSLAPRGDTNAQA
jgi:REP element-mobilizing transposase RayT